MSFKDLSQLKQFGTPYAYISKFQKVAVMVNDVSKALLVILLTEGLADPLRGLVRLTDLQHFWMPLVELEIFGRPFPKLDLLQKQTFQPSSRIQIPSKKTQPTKTRRIAIFKMN